ncbi:MAG: RedB protein [Planctomycetota bacterium]
MRVGLARRVLLPWLVFVVVSMGSLATYAQIPGAPAAPPLILPDLGTLKGDEEQFTMLLFIHPQCSCSHATIDQLSRVMARSTGSARVTAVFLKPKGTPEGWERTDLWRSAAAIPGVEVIADPGGRTAARFGVETSGQVLLYRPDGRLAFRGGLTSGRGHTGDSVGSASLQALFAGGTQWTSGTATFGCGLFDPVQEEEGADDCINHGDGVQRP